MDEFEKRRLKLKDYIFNNNDKVKNDLDNMVKLTNQNKNYNIIDGDLIELAKEGKFDVITHGCNCFNKMKAGIAPKLSEVFDCDIYDLEYDEYEGDINKLGQIDYRKMQEVEYNDGGKHFVEYLWDVETAKYTGRYIYVINSYTQYRYGKGLHLDYEALTLCLRKINHIFKGKHIGLPKIGCGLAGGNWNIVSDIIERELKDMEVTIINFKK